MNRREFHRKACVSFCGVSLLLGSSLKNSVCAAGEAAIESSASASSSGAVSGAAAQASSLVSDEEMARVWREVQTPYKYGIVISEEDGEMVDCPNLFYRDGVWYMVYVRMTQKIGYEGCLACSKDLLHWTRLGETLTFKKAGWDAWQTSPSAALVDHNWGGTYELQSYRDRYWFTYLGGAGKGYEPDPLKIGIAWTERPTEAREWTRHPKPIMSPEDIDARAFEKTTLYKTNVIWDREERLGVPFVVYYNGKTYEGGKSVERIGMAISEDMIHWTRYGQGPVIDNGCGISGDPQVVRMGDLWVMFYFGAFWKPNAFDTFACSRDMVHWRLWSGPHLIEPSESWDKQFAHKPWLIKKDGVVYHYYCAVGDKGRCIALATSKELK